MKTTTRQEKKAPLPFVRPLTMKIMFTPGARPGDLDAVDILGRGSAMSHENYAHTLRSVALSLLQYSMEYEGAMREELAQ